jgi:GT2 family glycosyltransferase
VNWVVTVVHNNLDLTMDAVKSFLAQDIGDVKVLVVNNESTDNTASWLQFANSQWGVESLHLYPQTGVAHAWNRALEYLFGDGSSNFEDRVLVCNNDVVLRPDTYSLLDGERAAFVTAVGEHTADCLDAPVKTFIDEYSTLKLDCEHRPHPDFSCFMISVDCWFEVGPFDENFKLAFCEDWDYHCRMHRAGIGAYCIQLPFLHVGAGSQTVKRATDEERGRIYMQARLNRDYFAKKYGFEGGTPEYYKFFSAPAAPSPVTIEEPQSDP